MLRDIALYEFYSINDNESIMEYATRIADSFEGLKSILLYPFDNFYAEQYYNREDNKIQRFENFIIDDFP